MRCASCVVLLVAFVSVAAACMLPHDDDGKQAVSPHSKGSKEHTPPVKAQTSANWREAEKSTLTNQTQITFGDRFLKAGESYFSPDDRRIIFQAIETPEAHQNEVGEVGVGADKNGGKSGGEREGKSGGGMEEFYAMFVADVKREPASGRMTGIENIKRLSPKGSANTCGWFHPTDANIVIFASTLVPPTESTPPGYQRASGRYKWMFPPEMRIVRCRLDAADGTAKSLEVLAGDGKAYCAEGSLTTDGRHLLYCSLESGDGDLYVLDLQTKKRTCIVQAHGYDGGPFFSPDDRRICYRSDRLNNNLLQLFVGELAFNEQGEVVGLSHEYQLTDDGHVNWCPFWTRDGRRVVYASSQVGHHNYEVFLCDADSGKLAGSTGTIKYGTAQKRITHADGADVLPAFSSDGKNMIWTSKRGPDGESQLWVADFIANEKP